MTDCQWLTTDGPFLERLVTENEARVIKMPGYFTAVPDQVYVAYEWRRCVEHGESQKAVCYVNYQRRRVLRRG